MLHVTCSVAGLWGGDLRPQQRVQGSGKGVLSPLGSSCLSLNIEILDGTRIMLRK